MRKIVVALTIANTVVACSLQLYVELTGNHPLFSPTPFMLAALVTALAWVAFSKAFMARAWDEGYLKAVNDTKEAVIRRKHDALEFEASNPYRIKKKEIE